MFNENVDNSSQTAPLLICAFSILERPSIHAGLQDSDMLTIKPGKTFIEREESCLPVAGSVMCSPCRLFFS